MSEFYPDFNDNGLEKMPPAADAADEAVTAEDNAEDTTPPVQWYGVSYQGMGSPQTAVKKNKPRRHVSALVTLIVACCLLLATVAGLTGFLIAEYLAKDPPISETETPSGGNPQSGVIPGGSVGGEAPQEPIAAEGAETSAYADVVLPKNDGTALVDSVNGSAGENGKTLIAAIAEVRDSVVEIFTQTVSSYGQLKAGAGSGVIIHADGIIVTNNHVIEGAKNIYVRLTNGNTYEAYLRGTDEDTDIAILKISPKDTLTVAKLGSSKSLALGEAVFAIGNPLGQLGGTVTDGIISALERAVQMEENLTMTLIQTNAAINPGNSGGALFNMAGELIGVVNAKISDSAADSGVEGLGFAIPIDIAILSINDLLDYGYRRGLPSLGVTVEDAQIPSGWYYYLYPCVKDAPDGSALTAGDLIVAVDGKSVSTVDAIKRLIRAKYKIGDTVTLTIYRKNGNSYTETSTVQVTLVEYTPS